MASLVGRERELGVLDEALVRARAGERAVVLITGEPGIGKTRLLDELAVRGLAGDCRVAWGRTAEIGHTPAFWPWLQILSALEVDDDRAPRIGSLDAHADAASRLALFDATASFIARRAGNQPLVLLFDDVHAADPSSLQLLDYTLPLLTAKRVLCVLAARDAEASTDVAGVLGRIQRGARRIALPRLARADVDALVAGRADASRVFELSEGNPLFVEELVASAEGEGVLRLPVLSSVRAFIAERVARLPDPARRALVAAALVGRTFSAHVVEEMVGEGTDALQPAVRLGMIAMTTPDRFRFSHALVAEAIADELDPSERARLHLRAAQALEKHDTTDASAIAHHLLAAGNLAAEAAVGAAERAAQDAMTRHAFEDAAALLARAAAALQLAAPDDRKRRVALVCARAEALQYADQYAQAVALLDDIEPVVRSLDNAELFARMALVRGLRWSFGVTDPVLIAALRGALTRLDPAPSLLRARVLARLAAAEQPSLEPTKPVALAFEAITMAAGCSARERLDVMYTATGALVDYVPAGELEPIHIEVLALATSTGARVVAAHTQLRMCFTAIERLDRAAFDRSASAYRALATSLGSPRWLRHAHMLVALVALLDGRFRDAEQAAAEANRLSDAIGDDYGRLVGGIHAASAAFVRGTIIGTPDVDPVAMGPATPILHAWAAAHDGRLDEARTYLAASSEAMLVDRNTGAMFGAAVGAVGDEALACRTYDRIAPWSGTIALVSMIGFVVHDLFDRLLLVLASRGRRWDVIDEHAERALAISHQVGSPVWAARVNADWADALASRARSGDAERARELWREALVVAEQLDMPRLVARARAALGDRGEAAPRTRPRPGGDRVRIERTGQLWLVAGYGEEIHVRDSRGMQMLSRLVADAGREVHALDLGGAGEGVDLGDAGAVLDRAARSRYRERLADLEAERARAEEWGDAGRLERANAEIEALTQELSRAVGLGGKDRRVGAAAERARSNVQRRILHAIQQIRSGSQRLGEHFAATVRTGAYCCYDP